MTNLINAGNRISVALMAELVDAQVSGTCDRFGRGSSSLLQGTIIKTAPCGAFFIMVKRTCQFASPRQRSEANRQPRPRHCEQSEGLIVKFRGKNKKVP